MGKYGKKSFVQFFSSFRTFLLNKIIFVHFKEKKDTGMKTLRQTESDAAIPSNQAKSNSFRKTEAAKVFLQIKIHNFNIYQIKYTLLKKFLSPPFPLHLFPLALFGKKNIDIN